MPFEILVGLKVTGQELYTQYRTEIAQLLSAAGGTFRYDFEIAKTLKTSASHEINRVFVLQFPDAGAKEAFFSNPAYKEIRSRLFDRAVDGATVLLQGEQ